MSGTRALWYEGQAVTDLDLQRAADAAAVADDLVYQVLHPMTSQLVGGGLKRILPLVPEVEGGGPQLLVAPSSTPGRVSFFPSLLMVGSTPAAGAVAPVTLAARVTAITNSGEFASAGGSARTDLLYATVQRAVTASDSRKHKDGAGQVSTQTFDLESRATVTLQIAQGTTTAPGDSSTAWNFALAEVALPSSHVAGDPIDPAWITQVWSRAMGARKVVGAEVSTPAAGVIEVSQAGRSWKRYGEGFLAVVPFKHTGEGAGAATLAGDLSLLDWKNRLVRLSLIRAPSHSGAYPPPHGVTVGGASLSESSSWVFTGSTDDTTLWTSARGFVVKLHDFGGTQGFLRLSKPAGDPPDAMAGDNWTLLVETLDRFL